MAAMPRGWKRSATPSTPTDHPAPWTRARPDGKPPVEFPLVLISEEAIEFANPAHDYPQRIRYWRQGKLLMAEISLLDGSRSLRWNYRQVIPPQDE